MSIFIPKLIDNINICFPVDLIPFKFLSYCNNNYPHNR